MSFFQTLAECSVAFAGFAAIHAVLEGGTSGRILHRSFTVVVTGALAFVLSVLVLLLDQTGLSSSALWRWASAVGLAATALGGLLFFHSHRRLAVLGEVPQAPVVFAIAAALVAAAPVAMFVNLMGWTGSFGAPVYGAALTMVLLAGVIALLGSFWFPMEIAIEDKERERRSGGGG